MLKLIDSFTSTGSKMFAHQEAMRMLRDGKGKCVTTHAMLTDRCNHVCAFCSVQTRSGNTLKLSEVAGFLDILLKYGLKAVILSGGGNPILYRCPKTGADFNDVVDVIHRRGLEIGLITNGMPLKTYPNGRSSWKTVKPETLDKCTWIRISMSGFDHKEDQVFVPDIDRTKTTLGFSYVFHDSYSEPLDLNHGQVSTLADLHTHENIEGRVVRGIDRVPKLTAQIKEVVERHKPSYVRMLPNCLEPSLIKERCEILQGMADLIDPEVVFVQYKPPSAPNKCYLGYIHPVLNSDGYVYPCDSVVLAVADLGYKAGVPDHRFANPWRICHWSDIASIYEAPIRSLIGDPKTQCPGCVFPKSNALLEAVANGSVEPVPPTEPILHHNFV